MISPNGATKNEIEYIMTDKPDIFLDVLAINSINTDSDHCLVKGKARIDIMFERTKIATQQKKIDTGKLQHHRRELQVEIKNRHVVPASI